MGHGPSGPVLTASQTPVPGGIPMTRNEHLTFRFFMLQIYILKNRGKISTKSKDVTDIQSW